MLKLVCARDAESLGVVVMIIARNLERGAHARGAHYLARWPWPATNGREVFKAALSERLGVALHGTMWLLEGDKPMCIYCGFVASKWRQ